MSAKIIALIVAALGLGFTGTYFATSGDCSGGCPIAKFLHGDSTKSTDCCNPPSDCCEPASACCAKTAKAGSDCCAPGAACCAPGAACCAPGAACCEKTEPVSVKKKPCCPNCEADEAKKTEEIKK